MGKQKNRTNFAFFHSKATKARLSFFLIGCFLPSAQARVLDATVKPTLNISQMYSDNLRLSSSSSQTQGGFITQLAPTLQITRDSARSKFNLNARLQYLYYEGIDINSRLYPQLQMSSKTEIFDDSIFIDSSSRIAQGNANGLGLINGSNIYQSANINSTTYSSFVISPYWTPNLGGYANGEVRFRYNYFNNSNQQNAVNNTPVTPNNTIPNLESQILQESVYLVTGRQFESSGVSGRLSINNSKQYYQSGNVGNLRFRSYNGEVNYRLSTSISAFVQAGYYDNTYPNSIANRTAIRAIHNGIYLTPGLSWVPSPNFSLAVGYGLNTYFGNVTWHPSQQTSFHLNYRNSKVGGGNYYGYGQFSGIGGSNSNYIPTNTSPGIQGSNSPTGALGSNNAGSVWNGSLQHHTRTTTWTASYYTFTTTLQQYLSSALYGNSIGATNNERDISLPNLTNSLMLIKRAQGSVLWKMSKSSVILSAYQSNINYSSTNSRPQDIFGVSASWNWNFSPRMSATLGGTWQSNNQQSSALTSGNHKNEYFNTYISLNRKLSSSATGSLQYFYSHSNANNLSGINNILGGLGAYDSNRITANLYINF